MASAQDAPRGSLKVRDFFTGHNEAIDYLLTWQAMQRFTHQRTPEDNDELWLLQHSPVFTLGQAGKPEHVLDAGDIPLVKVDRGGQVTYHGPGQLMIYTMIDLPRQSMGVRLLIETLENVIIGLLNYYQVDAYGDRTAPGVYVQGKKIAAVGLRVSRGCSYHGVCFNYAFDSSPFLRINPCGFAGLEITQLSECVTTLPDKKELIKQFIKEFSARFDYTSTDYYEAQANDKILMS